MPESINSFLKIFLAALFFFSCLTAVDAQIRELNFNSPYRLKHMLALRTGERTEEFWFVGGQGNLVIIKGDERTERYISDADLNAIFMANEQTFFVVGTNGTLLVSKNRGVDWKKIELSTKVDLASVFCLNENKCWAVGKKDGILLSGGIDGKWKVERIVSDGELEDVYFVNEKVGFAVGDDNLLLKTDDGGENWWRINLNYKTRVWQFKDGKFWLEAVSFLNEQVGCVAGWDLGVGIVACTSDQGENWKVQLLEGQFDAIVWKSKTEVYLIDRYGKNQISKDAGQSWEPVSKK